MVIQHSKIVAKPKFELQPHLVLKQEISLICYRLGTIPLLLHYPSLAEFSIELDRVTYAGRQDEIAEKTRRVWVSKVFSYVLPYHR